MMKNKQCFPLPHYKCTFKEEILWAKTHNAKLRQPHPFTRPQRSQKMPQARPEACFRLPLTTAAREKLGSCPQKQRVVQIGPGPRLLFVTASDLVTEQR